MTIAVRPGDKFLIAGQNGSGKSVLASAIANAMQRVLVYDPKDDPSAELPNAAIVHTARDAIRALPGRVIYRPTRAEMASIESKFDEIVAKLVTDRRPHGILIHELGDLTTERRIGPALSEAIRKGRSLGITLVLVTQRPQGIAVMTRSEAQHVACFTLLDPNDRDAMAALMGPAIRLAPLPLDHRFWYRGPDLRLQLCRPLELRGSDADPSPATAARARPAAG